ncbi:hypothetical protein [Cupriavidus campinensis]
MKSNDLAHRRGTLRAYLVEGSGLLRARLARIIVALEGVELVGTAQDIATAAPSLGVLVPDVVILGLTSGQPATRQWLGALTTLGQDCRLIVLMPGGAGPLRRIYLDAGAHHAFDKTAEIAELRKTLIRMSGHAGPRTGMTRTPPKQENDNV